jgi:hypothetical protein
MKYSLFLALFISLGTSLLAQIELPLQRNYQLHRIHQEQTLQMPKGWQQFPTRQRECMLEDDDFFYVDAGEELLIFIDIDTSDVGAGGTFACLNCTDNTIGQAAIQGDTLLIQGDAGLVTSLFTFELEYCLEGECLSAAYEVIGRRKGNNYFPPAIELDAEASTQVTAQASLLPNALACNKIIDAPDNYEGRSQLSYFTTYSRVDSTVNYLASRYAGTDSIYVVLCDSFAICDTFHYAFNIQKDTLKFGQGALQYFMDDFSYGGPFTSDEYWLDNETYVNRHYSEAPPSIGVATFDGLDISGSPWTGGFGAADRLTSTYLDLSDVTDQLYLSYWLNAKGLGLSPEEDDIFTLEFKDADGEWILIQTHTPSDTSETGTFIDSAFLFFNYEITEEFVHEAFQFRFTSFNERRGVNDIWNLDYVRINDEANLPIENDVSLTIPPVGVLDLYRSLPWAHFRGRAGDLSRSTLDVGLFNFDNNALNVGDAELRLVEEVSGNVIYENVEILNEQSPNLSPGSTFLTPANQAFSTQIAAFESGTFDNQDLLRFRMSYELEGPPNQNATLGEGRDGILVNDTASQVTVFSNYFAYDDGTAENAVAAQENDQIAVQFNALVSDTLRAVQIHFPHLLSDVSTQTFNLKVWIGDLEGEPDFRMDLLNPFYPDSAVDTLQGFTSYPLSNTEGGLTPIAIPAGDFYIAIQQQSDCDFTDCIPIGMDRGNPAALSTLFFSDNGNTFNPFPEDFTPGALMIRPVVGSETPLPTSTEEAVGMLDGLQVFPNPTQGTVQLRLVGTNYDEFEIAVFNNMGQMLLQQAMQPTLDLSSMENGLYILQVIHPESGERFSQRLVLVK